MNEALKGRIGARRQSRDVLKRQIATLQAELLTVEVELGAYEDALRLVSPVEANAVHPQVRAEPPETGAGEIRLSPTWRQLFHHALDVYPDVVTSQGLREHAEASSLPITARQVRSVSWSHVNRGTLSRVSPGVFRITAAGAAAIGRSLPPAAAGPTSDDG